ncbi:MAG: rod shape-determining protein [Synergistales bacterium]|nr:rod shape-determining protein [Synergistales bacterium]MDY6402206.1 rod shape-determining protein [Synergistales bacterium]MDY6404154.1 rod shape-determining protein [Synergistales bacterium]MDY6409774.1 rod shape-determining protein [Synergistales bacterium]MDY6414191.1 rod shape-determining protein [Synergistales bacterium]
MLKYFSEMLGLDVGIDLGSSNIVVYVKDKGIVFSEPSAIAAKRLPRGEGYEIIAVGRDAKAMSGKVPSGIEALWPLEGGVIANFDMTQELLRYCLKRVSSNSAFMVHPRVVISIPAEVTGVERKAVIDATLGAGAGEAYVVEEPISAALGVGLPIDKPNGCMIIDIGGGTSEVSVISLGGVVVSSSLRTAGRMMDNAIINMIRQRYALLIGETTAEEVKNTIGSALPMNPELEMNVKGRDLSGGLPKSDTVSSIEVREAMEPIFIGIEDMVKTALEKMPPELAKDVVDRGIVLTGGVALMNGFAERLSRAINTPVVVAEEPLYSVALGVGKILDNLGQMRRVLMSVERGAH